ncbi:MAG: tRNA (adenosine(37)-N6)-threonylcarbamoyltransferase complex dimerization subunit type 1 TsaB [Proteobacteria bacterium]|nr:tRNA (adenosine(37)-N6)-threonylcarbamoyltransferase complex dimerization subunit type 1 TsaB [Pseudomonadota bacterium]
MLVLGLSTATPLGGVALIEDEVVLEARRWRAPRSHGRYLWPALQEVLNQAGRTPREVDLVAACVGPGSFTGLRVGLAAAQGMALAAGRPAIGLDSLFLLAGELPWSRHPVRPVVDVRRGQVATALYDTLSGRPEPRGQMESLTPAQVVERLDGPTILVGNGLRVYAGQWPIGDDRIRHAPPDLDHPRPEAVALWGRADHLAGKSGPPEALRPIYARPPNAVLPGRAQP